MPRTETPSPAEADVAPSGAAAVHSETILRTGRTLSALTGDFDRWIAEEIDTLVEARETLFSGGPTQDAAAAFRRSVLAMSREAIVLGYPLVAEIGKSLRTIVEAMEPEALPHDLVDAHIETMAIVASDRAMSPRKAQEVVANLAAAAADYVAAERAC